MSDDALKLSFHHLHMYIDTLKSVEDYKKMEAHLNTFGQTYIRSKESQSYDIDQLRRSWAQIVKNPANPDQFTSSGNDLITQLLHGVGWRVVGDHEGNETRSLCVRPVDQNGTQFILTCKRQKKDDNQTPKSGEDFDHFREEHLERFFSSQNGHQGIACLGFQVEKGNLEKIFDAYQKTHPKLAAFEKIKEYPGDGFRIFEVFAYYQGEKLISDADRGTVIRFVEIDRTMEHRNIALPGIEPIEATYDDTCLASYCDHWVSNVISREGFLETLEETLGFNSKVDFNAGVVAAGEAQIESTVTGNTSQVETSHTMEALKDHSQVYLPINNALSQVGHVHWFLEQIGQGVQHVANRVEDLPNFIQRANDYREITGEGFSFLNIPRSYYGRLTEADFDRIQLPQKIVSKIFQKLSDHHLMDSGGVIDLEITDQKIKASLAELRDDLAESFEEISTIIKRSRYGNLHKLLKDHLQESSYLKIVRNKILVDIQGGDLLYQIFTSNIMQRKPGEEAPFLEFIQRLCSEKTNADGTCKPIKPGCGGFGIRNFLTLFLSIEVSKAMNDLADAKAKSDKTREEFANHQIRLFTAQLDESNPILTMISDAMTAEGELREAASKSQDETEQKRLFRQAEDQQKLKEQGQKLLQDCSKKYARLMNTLRSD